MMATLLSAYTGRMYAHDIPVVYVAPQGTAVALFAFQLSLLSKQTVKRIRGLKIKVD